jgi:hypothetical protein
MTFIPIDPNTLNFSKPYYVKKVAPIQARPALDGEVLCTVMSDGFVETLGIAQTGDWIITNPGGEQYIVSDFTERYEEYPGMVGFYVKRKVEQFVYAPYNLSFSNKWGEDFKVKKGGAIVKSADTFYGIQPEELNNREIYQVI